MPDITEEHIYNRIAIVLNAKFHPRSSENQYTFAEIQEKCERLREKGLAIQTYADPKFIADVIITLERK